MSKVMLQSGSGQGQTTVAIIHRHRPILTGNAGRRDTSLYPAVKRVSDDTQLLRYSPTASSHSVFCLIASILKTFADLGLLVIVSVSLFLQDEVSTDLGAVQSTHNRV
jgi:hypothetical protein